jgi:hypothetical protein
MENEIPEWMVREDEALPEKETIRADSKWKLTNQLVNRGSSKKDT